jgi:hypothetical protein
MTQNRKLAKVARQRAAQTGEPYMEARRQIEAELNCAEPYYRLHRRDGVERIDGDARTEPIRREASWAVDTDGAWWGYAGSGPTSTAK